MDYHHVNPDEIEPSPGHPCDRRSISEATGLGVLAVARYELMPGEELADTYHYHEHREEVFIVTDGVLVIETPTGEFTVSAGDVFVVEPDSPIRPHNPQDADQPVRAYGVGAPSSDIGRAYSADSSSSYSF